MAGEQAGAKRAAINPDALGDKPLSEVSAADFLEALNAGGVSLQHVTVWPEKKKVELWAEPENAGQLVVKDVVRVIRAEKKKVELEPWLDFNTVINPASFEVLVDRVAREVEARLGRS